MAGALDSVGSAAMHVVQVGCGPWGANVLRDLRILGCTVTVVARHDTSRQRALDGGAEAVLGSVAQLEGRPAVSGAVVVTEATDHRRAVGELLPLGCPVFVEKPLALTPADADWIVERGAGRVFVMDKWRYHAGVATLRGLVAAGRLGVVLGVRTRRNQPFSHHPDADPPWTLMPHDLAIVEELIGDVPPLAGVVADGGPGQIRSIIATFGSSPWVVVESIARAPRVEREVMVIGTDGVAVLGDGYAEEVLVGRATADGATWERVPAVGEWPLLAELREFVGYLGGGPAPRATATDGARHVRIIAEVFELAGGC
jgi:predicted dehydrogenase